MSGEGIFDRIGERLDSQEREQAPPSMSDILDLPEEPRSLMRYVLRSPVPLTLSEVAAGLGWELAVTQQVVGELSFRGMIDLANGSIQVVPMQRTTRQAPGGMWSALKDL
jgi:hypothetical protein